MGVPKRSQLRHVASSGCLLAAQDGNTVKVGGAKVRTLMLRDREGVPAAVVGYVDASATEDEVRKALNDLEF